jgi:hypothetical protein
MLSYLQMGLLLAGTTGFGAILCGPGVVYFMVWVARPRPGQLWTGGLLLLVILFGGSLAGAIAGFRTGMRWFGRRGITPWTAAGWIGAVVGVLFGVWLLYSGKLGRFELLWFPTLQWLIAVGFVACLAAAGGWAGQAMEGKWKQHAKPIRKKRKRRVVRIGKVGLGQTTAD